MHSEPIQGRPLYTHPDLFCSPNMAAEAFGIATAAIYLAVTVFQTAKGTNDITHTVSSSTLILARP